MPHPLPRRTYYRAAAIRHGLDPLIDALDAIPPDARRAPMPQPLRIDGWRRIAAARRQLGLPPLADSLDREKPSALAAEIASVLSRLTTLTPLQSKYVPDRNGRSYPRRRQPV